MRFGLLTICLMLAAVFWVISPFIAEAKIDVTEADIGTAPIVVELFTSQSCSSCPPADRALQSIAHYDNIIAMSCNVTYWNHLHWEDTLSEKFCTNRQSDYSIKQGRGGRVYTPEVVINGQTSIVGSRTSRIAKALQEQANSLKHIKIERTDRDTLTITRPAGMSFDTYSISLLSYAKPHTQQIPSGENRGREITYTNPVKTIRPLAEDVITLQPDEIENTAAYVVLVQEKTRNKVVAAGRLTLK